MGNTAPNMETKRCHRIRAADNKSTSRLLRSLNSTGAFSRSKFTFAAFCQFYTGERLGKELPALIWAKVKPPAYIIKIRKCAVLSLSVKMSSKK